MGRHLVDYSQEVEMGNLKSGCLWNFILHVLDIHHKYDAKKMVPHQKHGGGRVIRCCANPKTDSMERVCNEAKELHLDDELSYIEGTRSSNEPGEKQAVHKEKMKIGKHKKQHRASAGELQLQRTNSIHHMGPSGYGLGWMNPIILIQKKADSSSTRYVNSALPQTLEKPVSDIREPDSSSSFKADENRTFFEGELNKIRGVTAIEQQAGKKFSRASSDHLVQEHEDVLEIFKVNKELFIDIMQDHKLGISKHFLGKETSGAKALTKSGSFPAAGSPRSTYLRLTTLHHKQNEVWFFLKREKDLSNAGGAGFSSSASNHQARNESVMNHFKDIKQSIALAIKEKRKRSDPRNSVRHPKKGYPQLMEAVDEKKTSAKLVKTTMGQDSMNTPSDGHKMNASDYGLENTAPGQVRRTTSLNGSLGRYSQLFEQSFSKDAKLHQSKSLRLANEDKFLSREQTPKFFRRISSLSELESFVSILNEVSRDTEVENDSHSASKSVNIPVDEDEMKAAEAVSGTKLKERLKEERNYSSTDLSADSSDEGVSIHAYSNEDASESTTDRISTCQEQKNELAMGAVEEILQPDQYVPDTFSTDDITGFEEHPVSEGPELNPCILDINEPEPPFVSLERKTAESSSDFCNTTVHEDSADEGTTLQSHLLQNKTHACSNYISLALHLSGFTGNESFTTWHSPGQPLSPSLFKNLETSYKPEEFPGSYGHQLLFDLVNESLVKIYDREPIYFPKSFSFSSWRHSMPKGSLLADEVTANVRGKLSSTPVQDQSLDDIVARDFTNDGWMNLQMEAECLALDLEQVIFDELLDEIICV